MKNQFKNFSKLGYIGMITLLLFAFVMVACKQDQDVMPEDTGKIRPTFGNKSAATCDFDANRFISIAHLHNQARITTKGVDGFSDQLHTASGGATVNVGPLRFTSSGNKVEIGGGEGYGVTSSIDGNTSKKKFINNGEKLTLQTRNTSNEILKAELWFRGTGDSGDIITIKASKGNRCVGEITLDLSNPEDGTTQMHEICFGQSFTRLEITADADNQGVRLAQTSKLFVGTQTFIYDLMAGPFDFEHNALSFLNVRTDGTTRLNERDAATTALGWHTEYRNDDCDGTGSVYRYYLRRQDTGELLAGVAGNNGLRDPSRIFAYKRDLDDSWAFNVPFVLIRKYHGRSFKPAIATPRYQFSYPNQFNQARFEAPTNGVVTFTDAEGTNWEARQGDLNGNNLERVQIYKNGSLWARTSRGTENGTLVGFTILPVRVGLTTDAAGNIQNVYEYVPFALVDNVTNKGLTLQTGTRIAFNSQNIRLLSPIQEQLSF